MGRPVDRPEFWAQRLANNHQDLRQALFPAAPGRWDEIQDYEMIELADVTGGTSVLDCGCGYGRLLQLLPREWTGHYQGVDISPDMIRLAKEFYPSRKDQFMVADLRRLPFLGGMFDVAVVASVRGMVTNDLGSAMWLLMESEITRVAKRVIYTEYGDA